VGAGVGFLVGDLVGLLLGAVVGQPHAEESQEPPASEQVIAPSTLVKVIDGQHLELHEVGAVPPKVVSQSPATVHSITPEGEVLPVL